MATDMAVRENGARPIAVTQALLERSLIVGDLSQLTPGERVSMYLNTCETLGLNPFTKPFDYLELKQDGTTKLILYANKNCAEQLRGRDKVTLTIVSRELVEDIYVVTARASLPDGRSDESIGAVTLSKEDGEWRESSTGKRYFQGNGKFVPLRGDARANAVMKAETKAKRRATLSLCGLGFIDESEVDSIEGARRVVVDHDSGEILSETAPRPSNGNRAKAEPPPKPAAPKAVDRVAAEAAYRAECDKADTLNNPADSWNPSWSDLEVVTKFRELRNANKIKEKSLADAATADTADLFDEAVAT